MKNQSISRQLLWLTVSSVVALVVISAAFYTTVRKSMSDASSLTQTTVTNLNVTYDLLANLSKAQSALQTLLRQKDPDEIEKSVSLVEQTEKKVKDLIAGAGENGRAIESPFSKLLEQQKAVIEPFLNGNLSAAYERFLTGYTPQYELTLKAVEECNDGTHRAVTTQTAAQNQRVEAALRWRLSGIAVVLLALSVFGWRLKTRISRQLNVITTDLCSVSDVVTKSAAQISVASQSLAEGASEQAASLEETGASLEEMASVTRQNADGAEAAKNLAEETRVAAEEGARDMQTMSEAMAAIRVASNNIAKIIKTIDEIAFQTNILALNAAVEAARAGEAGMGFAVVADEVRSLAQRCAQAARETTAKIEDSVAKSERGAQLNEKVAQSLAQIVEKARRVDQLVAEIATASKEQSQGISQVNTAVAQMDKVIQSNAANAEETAAATGEMNSQMASLQKAVQELRALTTGAVIDVPSQHRSRTQAGSTGASQSNVPSTRWSAGPVSGGSESISLPASAPGAVKELIQWDSSRMSTGSESIDAEHRELIQCINQLHTSCIEGRGREEVIKLLAFLGNYVKEHFAHEEALMNERRCSVRGQNKAAHIQFLKSYEELVDSVRKEGTSTALLLRLKELVADWLTEHICTIDTRLRECPEVESVLPRR